MVLRRAMVATTLLLSGSLLSGCLMRAAADVATAPVRAGAKLVDWTTTSRDEADRNRGRAMRKQEKEERKRLRDSCGAADQGEPC